MSAKKKRLKLKFKIILSYVLVLIFAVISITVFSYYRSVKAVEKVTVDYITGLLGQLDINISQAMFAIKERSDFFYSDDRIQKVLYSLTEKNDRNIDIDSFNIIDSFIRNIENMQNIYKIRIFIDEDVFFANENVTFFSYQAIQKHKWYDDVVKWDGKIIWSNTYKHNFIGIGEQNIISCLRVVKSIRHDTKIAIMSIDILEKTLSDIMDDAGISKKGNTFIVDGQGNIISSDNKEILGEKIDKTYILEGKYDAMSKIVWADGTKYLIHNRKITYPNWSIITAIPYSVIQAESIPIIKLGILYSIITICLTVLFSICVSNRMFSKLYYLVEQVLRLRQSNLYEKDEMNQVVKTFHNLVEERYKAQLFKKEAELKILQSQINPHFLYNTLESINWLAIKNNMMDISLQITSLAKFFRLVLENDDIVSLRHEIEHVRVYLELQKNRFEERLNYKISADNKLMEYKVPKLTLQPLVENAINHGILEMDRNGMIEINCYLEDQALIINISDNGCGADLDRINNILNEKIAEEESHHGIRNVNERIKLYFGNKSGLTYSINNSGGITVIVTIKQA